MIEIFLSDIHFPYEDRAAWGVTLEAIKALEPSLIFLGGDILDFYSVSRYDKDPARKLTLQEDLDYAIYELGKLREVAPDARMMLLQGNHEQRLEKYLSTKASELSNLRALSLDRLLNLESLGIEYIENGTRIRIGKLWHFHGNEIPGAGINVARNKFMKINANMIFGHHHVMQNYIQRNYEGEVHGAWANPCLCELEAEYAHFTNWSWGFSVIEYSSSENFNVDQVSISKPDMYSSRASLSYRGQDILFQAPKVNPNTYAPHVDRVKKLDEIKVSP